jgi:hypothetical protein
MKDHYGFVDMGPVGRDGEKIDIWVGPNLTDGSDIYIFDQHTNTGLFDEPKAIIGVANEEEALALYKRNNPEWVQSSRAPTRMTTTEFVAWLDHANLKIPANGQVPITKVQWRGNAKIRPDGFSDIEWNSDTVVQEIIDAEYNRYLWENNLPGGVEVKDHRPADIILYEEMVMDYLSRRPERGSIHKGEVIYVPYSKSISKICP